jgi:hypothetical protein
MKSLFKDKYFLKKNYKIKMNFPVSSQPIQIRKEDEDNEYYQKIIQEMFDKKIPITKTTRESTREYTRTSTRESTRESTRTSTKTCYAKEKPEVISNEETKVISEKDQKILDNIILQKEFEHYEKVIDDIILSDKKKSQNEEDISETEEISGVNDDANDIGNKNDNNMKLLTEEKEVFKCNICSNYNEDSSFRKKISLQNHINSQHHGKNGRKWMGKHCKK